MQECVYHKAVMDKKSPGVLARLAKQTSTMYHEVTAIFNQPAVQTHFERSWIAHTQMKVSQSLRKACNLTLSCTSCWCKLQGCSNCCMQ